MIGRKQGISTLWKLKEYPNLGGGADVRPLHPLNSDFYQPFRNLLIIQFMEVHGVQRE